MNLILILTFLILALLVGVVFRGKRRSWALFLLSVFSVYIFQPLVPLRNFDYWFPTASIVFTAGIWLVLRRDQTRLAREDILSAGSAILIVLLIGLTRFFPLDLPWLPGSLPSIDQIFIFLGVFALIAFALSSKNRIRRFGIGLYFFVLVGIFILIKTEPLSLWLSERIRQMLGQSTALASSMDLNWLGFSYISFRLFHTIRDHSSGRLPVTSLREYMTYVLFFPAIVAGPIDRIERFVQDLRPSHKLGGEQAFQAGRRILLGLFKKFVLADSLALLALNQINATLSTSMSWTWLLLYGYSFRLFLDFSGYTDVAIGIGMLTGVTLPENFDRPYLKTNLTSFWNAWHMSLARWFRSYVFNPLTRSLRTGILRNSPALIIMIGQVTTMVLIGLWHGITWNFAIWGLWHGIGLFIHNRWVNILRSPSKRQSFDRLPSAISQGLALLITFHFTALGWVWFALPDLSLSVDVLRTLFGISG